MKMLYYLLVLLSSLLFIITPKCEGGYCKLDIQCVSGYYCNPISGNCIAKSCKNQNDCPKGMKCDEYFCKSNFRRQGVLSHIENDVHVEVIDVSDNEDTIRQCNHVENCKLNQVCTLEGICKSNIKCSDSSDCLSHSKFQYECKQGLCKPRLCETDLDCPSKYTCYRSGYCRAFYGNCVYDCDCGAPQLKCDNGACICTSDEYENCQDIVECQSNGECGHCQICDDYKCVNDPQCLLEHEECPDVPDKQCCASSDCLNKCLGNRCCDGKCFMGQNYLNKLPKKCFCESDDDCINKELYCHICEKNSLGFKSCFPTNKTDCCGPTMKCGEREECHKGKCIKSNCRNDYDCNDNCYFCDNGICHKSKDCCENDQDCPSNQSMCDSRNKFCKEFKECFIDKNCPDCQTCKLDKKYGKRVCQIARKCCSEKNDCLANQDCINGGCVETVECSKNQDCPLCSSCSKKGRCIKSTTKCCQNNSDCDSLFSICINGFCDETQSQNCDSDSECPNCYHCFKRLGYGKCLKSTEGCCNSDSRCSNPLSYCVNNGCKPLDKNCSLDSDCPNCHHCILKLGSQTKVCKSADRCCFDKASNCVNGGIKSNRSCSKSSQCSYCEDCVDGICVTNKDCCKTSDDCQSGVCLNGICNKLCVKSSDCQSCHHCVPYKGGNKTVCIRASKCCQNDSLCYGSKTCQNGGCYSQCDETNDCSYCKYCKFNGKNKICTKATQCCVTNQDCPKIDNGLGEILGSCLNGVCQEYCRYNKDCKDKCQFCDTGRGICLLRDYCCITDKNCPNGGQCINSTCVGANVLLTCLNDEDCPKSSNYRCLNKDGSKVCVEMSKKESHCKENEFKHNNKCYDNQKFCYKQLRSQLELQMIFQAFY